MNTTTMQDVEVTPQRTLTLTLGPDDVCLVLSKGPSPIQPKVKVYLPLPVAEDKNALQSGVPFFFMALFNVARRFHNYPLELSREAREYHDWFRMRYHKKKVEIRAVTETPATLAIAQNSNNHSNLLIEETDHE